MKNHSSVRSDDYVSKAEEQRCSGQEGAALSCWEVRQAFGLWEAGAGRAVRLRKGKAGGKANRQDNGECRTWPHRSYGASPRLEMRVAALGTEREIEPVRALPCSGDGAWR